jgi:GntR family transcriptional regulator
MRRNVMKDKRLSAGARILWMWLDDMAAMRGETHPSNEYLATELSFSVRSVQRFLQELRAAGYIDTRQRANQSSTQTLGWVQRQAPTLALASKGERQKEPTRAPTVAFASILNQDFEPSTSFEETKVKTTYCEQCEGTGMRGYPEIGGGFCDCQAGIAKARKYA